MARSRRPEDWERDTKAASAGEQRMATTLGEAFRANARVRDFEALCMGSKQEQMTLLDFRFLYDNELVWVDLKEKGSRYDAQIQKLWPSVPEEHMFIVDETTFRKVVWQGGGGYLVLHDKKTDRWCTYGPWELTLAPSARYQRWEQKAFVFTKGKLLFDLRRSARTSAECNPDDLLATVEHARSWRMAVEAYPIRGIQLPEVGTQPEGPTKRRPKKYA